MLTFQNPGVIDLFAAVTFGVSAKEGDSPIGFFGTGLKYAVAIVLRLGGTVTLWCGLERHEFTLQRRSTRGLEFDVVCLDGQPLAFTTRLGINWEPWMAFRELYCNALDERGAASMGELEPADDCTTIHVTGLDAEFDARHQVVIDRSAQPVLEVENVKVYRGGAAHYYCRGVRVHKLAKPSRFTYDFQQRMDLTEDRTLSNPFMADYYVSQALMACDDDSFLREVLSVEAGFYEHEVSLTWGGLKPKATFLDVVGELRRTANAIVNKSAIQVFAEHRPEPLNIATVEPNEIEAAQLEKALAFLSELDHEVDPASIRIVADLGPGVLGKALRDQGLILLPRRTFDMGTKYVASTLLEEHIHIVHNLDDCTREFQNFILDRLMSIGERFVGSPL